MRLVHSANPSAAIIHAAMHQQWQERCKQSSAEGKSALQVFYVKENAFITFVRT